MAHQSLSRRALIVILVASLAAANCASYRPIRVMPPPAAPGGEVSNVKPGDTLILKLQSGRKVTLKVATIAADAVVSTNGERVLLNDIAEADLRSRGVPGWAIGSLAAAGAIALLTLVAIRIRAADCPYGWCLY